MQPRGLWNTDAFFSGDVFTQVEKSLRNDGKHNVADRVYIQMQERLKKKMWADREIVPWFLSAVNGRLTKYGTSALRPFLCILAIMVFNILLLSTSQNVVASTDYLAAISGHEARASARLTLLDQGDKDIPIIVDWSPDDLGHNWSAGDVIAITTRFSGPLITLAMSDRWEPARRAALVPCFSRFDVAASLGRCSLPVRVATITRVLGYLSWIFWPLFIIRVSGVIKRRG